MKNEMVTGEIGLWAVPRDPAYVDPGENPFSFEICMYTANHWKKGAICVASQIVEMAVPTNIDFRGKAVETLEAAIEQVQAEATKQVAELKAQINNLLMLTHQTESQGDADYLMGELVDDYRGADHE